MGEIIQMESYQSSPDGGASNLDYGVFDRFTRHIEREQVSIKPRRYDDDVRQQALLRTLNAWLNKGNCADGFKDFCATPHGIATLRLAEKHAFFEMSRKDGFVLTRPTTDEERFDDEVLWPSSHLFEDTNDYEASQFFAQHWFGYNPDSNLNDFEHQMSHQETIQELYDVSTPEKKQAMQLLVECQEIRNAGQPIPKAIRTRLSRLRAIVQKQDPTWKLVPTLL